MNKVLIAAGGTGGHIFPGMAVAELLCQHGVHIEWLGSVASLEARIVSPHYQCHLFDVRRLRGKSLLNKAIAIQHVLLTTIRIYKIIRKIKPNLLIAFGGFVSGPAGVAAKLAGVPLVIHEQNAVAGLTNRILSYLANAILQAYPSAFHSKKNPITVGNPVRRSLAHCDTPEQRMLHRKGPINVLVLGGSQGALAINQAILNLLKDCTQESEFELYWQTGQLNYADMQQHIQQGDLQARVQPFIDDMNVAYQWADLVICRAGAITLAEIMTIGIASILIPLPQAADNHQYFNARYLEAAGAAIILPQSNLTARTLQKYISEFADDRARLVTMASAAKRLAVTDSAQQIIDCCAKYLTMIGRLGEHS